ncbi:hypothetical protein [Brachyspira pilosicoli]
MFLLLSGASPRTPSSFATVGSAGGVAQRTKKTSFFSLKCWYYNIVYTYSKIYKAIVFALFSSLTKYAPRLKGVPLGMGASCGKNNNNKN